MSLLPAAKRQKLQCVCVWCGDEYRDEKELKQHIDAQHPTHGAACRSLSPIRARPLSRLTPFPLSPTDLDKPGVPTSSDEGNNATKFVKVNGLCYAGLATTHGPVTLYVRKEVKEMWEFLEEPGARTSLVQGPPGTGKSSTTWVSARKHAAGGKTVLWAHLRKDFSATVAQLQGTTVIAVGAIETTTLIKLVRHSTADTIVLDGVVGTTNKELLEASDAWVAKMDGRRVVRVTSESIKVTVETCHETSTHEHTVPSWTLEQYKIAVESNAFKQEVEERLGNGETLDEKLANKFFVAGACARWMFGFTMDRVLGDIDKHIDGANDKQALLSGLMGQKAAGAVNHLIQRSREGGVFLVSDYVARCLAKSCELAFVRQAMVQAQGNPGFDGIVLELDFMAQLRTAKDNSKSLVLRIGDSKEEKWSVENLINFTQPSDLQGDRLNDGAETFQNKFSVANGSWLLPKLFNQGGYDAVQVVTPEPSQATHIHVRFVQVTRSNTHTLKLKYMLELLRALVAIGFTVDNVLVDFVVPAGQCGEFTLGSTSGSLDNFSWQHPATNEFGQRIRVAGFERTK